MGQEIRRALKRALAADARPWRPSRQRRRLGPVPDDSDAILRTKREQTFASSYGKRYRRALADKHRHAATVRAERCQPRTQPPPPGPSAFQRWCEARDRCDRLEIAAAQERQRRTPGSALWGLIVLPPGDTRIGSMTLTVNRCRRIDRGTARPRRRRSHRTAARPTVGGDSGDDGEPPEPEPPGSRRTATGGAP